MTKTGQRVQLSTWCRERALASMLAAGLVGAWGCGGGGSPGGPPPDGGPPGRDGGLTDGGATTPDGAVSDHEPPTALIVFPPPRSVTDAAAITVHGTSGDAKGVSTILVNGTAATSDDGFATWTAEVALAEGDNELVVTARDPYGNETGAAARVTVGPSAPEDGEANHFEQTRRRGDEGQTRHPHCVPGIGAGLDELTVNPKETHETIVETCCDVGRNPGRLPGHTLRGG